jgi:hypothetical protein
MDWKPLPIPATADGGLYILANCNESRGACISWQYKCDREYNDSSYTHYMGPLSMPPKRHKLLSQYSIFDRDSTIGKTYQITDGTGHGVILGFLSQNGDIVYKNMHGSTGVASFNEWAPQMEILE